MAQTSSTSAGMLMVKKNMINIDYKTFLTCCRVYTQALIYKRYHGRYFARHSFSFCNVTGFDTKESIPFAKHSSALSANAFAVICISTNLSD